MTHTDTAARATTLLELHRAPELLTVVNVWDVVQRQGRRRPARHQGARDRQPLDRRVLRLRRRREHPASTGCSTAVGRIVAATDLPVTADLEGGYGNAAETIRRAIGIGVVGANLEDQMKPLAEAVAQVEADHEGRRGGGRARLRAQRPHRRVREGRDRDPADVLADAVERGKAFLDAGAPVVFVPGRLDRGADRRRWSTPSARSASPPSPSPARRRWRGRRSTAWPASPSGRCRRTSPSPRCRSWSRRCTAAAAYRPRCGS